MLIWQSKSYHPVLRVIAMVVVFTFTVTTVAWADGTGGTLSSLQQKVKFPALTHSDLNASHIDLETVLIPDSIGTIKRSFKGAQDRMVIHIQDAHVNEEAQRNIASTIEYLHKTLGVRMVGVEGSSGDLNTEILAAFPDENARIAVANAYLREGLVSGPEYLAITKVPALRLFGSESDSLYEENRKAFLDALEFKDESVLALSHIRTRLDQISRFVFSNELRSLVQEEKRFKSQKSYLNQ